MAVRLGVVGVVLGATAAVVPGRVALAAAGASGAAATPSPYAFADGARSVEGARSTADAVILKPGTAYKSSLPSSGKVNYSIELDAASNAYVSVTAAPSPDSTVSVIDGLRVSMQDAEGNSCFVDTASFGAARSPHPIAAWGVREISPAKPLCRKAGTYYVSVERVDPEGEGSSPDAWDLELLATTEPRTAKTGATGAPEVWDSASPQPLQGEAERRRGGAGFAGATPSTRASGGTTSGPARRSSTRYRSTGASSSTSPPSWAARTPAAPATRPAPWTWPSTTPPVVTWPT